MFRRLRIRLKGERRFRDASYARPNLSRRTEASGAERLMRALRRRESMAYDDGEKRLGDGVRLGLVWGLTLLAFWFIARSALAFDIFA